MICLACHKKGGQAKDRCPFCGTPYTAESQEKFSEAFQLSMDKEALFDFHVRNIDLDFDMDCVHRMNKALGIGKTTDYDDDEGPDEPPDPDEVDKDLNGIPDHLQGDQPSEEPAESENGDDSHGKLGSPQAKLAIRIVGAIILALILFFAFRCIFFYLGTWQPFQKALSEGDYVKAVEIYDKSSSRSFRNQAKSALDTQAAQVLEDYRENRITGEEARKRLDSLAMVSGTDELSDTYSEAAALERSKKAYQEGLIYYQAGDYVSATECWANVSEADTQNYQDVKAKLAEDKVQQALQSEVDGYKADQSSESPSRLMQALMFLKSLLPDIKGIDSQISDLEPFAAQEYIAHGMGNGTATGVGGQTFDQFTSDVEINKNAPVKISTFRTTRPNTNGGIDLIIRWQNRSGRVIKRIIFIVKPTNDNGTELGCRKNGYSTYYAIDNGPYANGQGTPTDTWMWENAWYNSLIAKASLLQVNIEYEDGGSATISDEDSLNALFS